MSLSFPPPLHPQRSSRRLVLGLLALSFVPLAAGTARLVSLASGGPITNANRRFFAQPLPVVVHVLGAFVFCLGGIAQFSPTIRVRRPRTHRVLGRAVVTAAVVVALSGLWMTHRYDLPSTDNALLGRFRDVAGASMLSAAIAGVLTARKRQFTRHRHLMALTYAIGLGAGTQVFTHLGWTGLFGTPTAAERAWLMLAGWAINVAVVEMRFRGRWLRLTPDRVPQP